MSVSSKRADPETFSQDRVPGFFIVGHAKSGTTALYEMLRRHPQIYMPDVKEPMFFARSQSPPGVHTRPFERTGRRTETLEDYLSLFAAAGPDQLVGEASTFYLWSPTAPARIAEAQPGARIVAILREPASFLRSLHLQMVQNHAESEKDLRKALALEDARREGVNIPRHAYWPAALIYSDRVRYAEQLRRYQRLFDDDQILVLIYDDFRRDNVATVQRVMRFLGVDDDRAAIERIEANPSVSVRSVRLDRMTRNVKAGRGPAARLLNTTVRALTTSEMRSRGLYPLRRRLVYSGPRAPDEALMSELRQRFRGEVEAVSEHLGRDLVTLWGYDDLD
jgi:hypothetical protein